MHSDSQPHLDGECWQSALVKRWRKGGHRRCLTISLGSTINLGLTISLATLAITWLLVIAPAFGQEFEYRLGTGDQLRVTVFGQEDLSGEFKVGSNGEISLPLIGKVAALGRTLQELELAVIDKLKPDYLRNPQVSIDVLNYRPFYIIGEVKSPGSYPYVGGMRVVNAVAMAGGFTYRARENKLLITRAENPEGEPEIAEQNTLVLPGDVIKVPERFF